jgi:hypothetical protein
MSVDPVRIQIGIRLAKDAPVTHEFLRSVIVHWAEGDRLPRGIRIVYVRWINPRRTSSALAVWKDSRDSDQSLQGARTTLRGLLLSGKFSFEIGFKKPPKTKITIVKKKRAKKKVAKSRKRKLQHVRKNKGVRK